MSKQFIEDTDGVPTFVHSDDSDATVVVPYESTAQLAQERLRQLREEAEGQPN